MMWDLRNNRDGPPQVERASRSRERRPSHERGLAMPSPSFPGAQPSGGNPAFPQPFAPLGVPAGPSMHSSHSGHGTDYRNTVSMPRSATPYAHRETSLPRSQTPVATRPRSASGHHHHHTSHHTRESSVPRAPAMVQTRPRAHSSAGYQHASLHATQHTRHTHRHTHSHSHASRPQQQVLFQVPAAAVPRPVQYLQPGSSHVQGHPRFQYSKCTGRKKALCIGINYRGQANELRGCINDAKNVRNFLMQHYGYKQGDIVLLVDDSPHQRQLPTKRNIIDAMRWLVASAHPHDSLFFHYSGHGGQTPDLDGDETDGYDEVIFPLDYQKRGHIVDDEMHDIMVRPLPSGCRLTAVFDSCHSGTALDLPYIYHSNGRLKGQHITSRAMASKATPADVISWCGCKDDQTSADTYSGGVAVGAMSSAFITALSESKNQTYKELLRSVREILRKRYTQKPQLSSSHPIDTNLRFII